METGNYGEIKYLKMLNTNMGAHIVLYLYMVDGALIDCGPQIMEEELAPAIRELAPREVVLTHMHEDHCGMARWIRDELQIPIYLDSADIDEAAREGEYAEYRHLTWGERPAFDALPLPEVFETPHCRFETIDTPGHISHHRVLYEREKGWLFSGDLYVRGKMRFCDAQEDMKKTIASLQKVLALDFTTVFCAHAGVLEDGRERLQAKLDFLLGLQETVNSLRAQGLSDEEIDHRLFPDEQIITAVSDGEWSSLNIVKTI